MLTLASLELARAKRHRRPLFSCRTNSLQIATAALQAAQLERAPLLVTIDTTRATTLPHQALLAALLELGRSVATAVVIEAVVAGKEAASWWISHGVLVVTLNGSCDSLQRNLKHVAAEAYAHGAEVGLEPTDLKTLKEAEAVKDRFDAAFFRIAPREKMTEMQEYVAALELPVVVASLHLTPKKTRELIAAGCAGLTLDTELEEAFTAGIRTALRNRSATDPAKYLSYGATAVRELVRSHLNYFSPNS